MTAERQYVVTELMVAANVFHVTARTRQEAIEKVLRNEHDWSETTDVHPARPLRADDARTAEEDGMTTLHEQARAEAEKRRIEAEGDASAIFARLDAEARGQYEILAKKAEGLQKIVEACGGAKHAFQMMMLEHLDNLTEASAKAISNIKFDKIVVWENGGEKGSSTANFLQNMARSLPPMMHVMRDVAGIELPAA